MIIPLPLAVEHADGSYRLDERTQISAGDELQATAAWLLGRLHAPTGLQLPLAADGIGISLSLSSDLEAESYRLTSNPDGVRIVGGDNAGVFYGCQALLQLLPPQIFRQARVEGVEWTVPSVRITDAPRFRWRGAMLDVARHFLPKQDLLRFLDLMAMHRLNTLHLHLTDDQGWRVEIERFPRLTDVGAWRSQSQLGAPKGSPGDHRPHGGFYTHDDIREIVAFAAERRITVLPEIEMPGHVQAAIAAYPELGVTGSALPVATTWGISPHVLNTEETTVAFFTHVLDEVIALFPSPLIGTGGDECPKTEWRNDPRTQALMRQRGITDEHGLQAWFAGRIAEHLSARGRQMYAWDEILEGPAPSSTVVAAWRGAKGAIAAARLGHPVVSCPDDHVYLDYRQSERSDEPIPIGIPLSLQRCYEFEPIPSQLSDEQSNCILGGQANIWTEHMDSARVIDFYAFPRLCAIAEALWSGQERDFADFRRRLNDHLPRLDAYGVEYRPDTGPLPWQTRPNIPGKPVSVTERARLVETLVSSIDA